MVVLCCAELPNMVCAIERGEERSRAALQRKETGASGRAEQGRCCAALLLSLSWSVWGRARGIYIEARAPADRERRAVGAGPRPTDSGKGGGEKR